MPVSDAGVIDLVSWNPNTDEVVLVMVEPRPWGEGGALIPQLEAKIDAYLRFHREDRISREYTQVAGKMVRFQLDCREEPGKAESGFLARVRRERLDPLGIRLVVRVVEE